MVTKESDLISNAIENFDAQQIRARVAWLYFIGGMTQQEIADQLGMTRLRVNKILVQIRGDGSVVVDIRLPMANCIDLENKLKKQFALEDACVTPTLPNEAENQRAVGEAAGTVLDELLTDGMGVGVGWGRTLTAGLKRITPRQLTNSWVTSIMGGLTRGSGSSTFEVATGYAKAISAECWYLTAPLYFPSAESREALLSHHGIRETMRRANSVDVALVSCGDMSSRSQLIQTPTVSENLKSLIKAGAVGDLLGVFLDKNGLPVDHPLNDRVLSLSPEKLKSVRHTVLASGGLNKVDMIRAILRAGYVNRLVTDEDCASALLQGAT
jgi:DNA-binding transcriptional regulator LsrR (DeoR family)